MVTNVGAMPMGTQSDHSVRQERVSRLGLGVHFMVRRSRALHVFALFSVFAFSHAALAADIYAGPTRTYKTLASAVSAAQSGDRILLDAGTYTDDTAVTNVPLTIEGLGAGAVLHITQPIGNRKGIIVTTASLTVRNLTFDGAQVTANDGNNGAGIRHQAGNLVVDGCTFTNNQDGILVNP